MIEALSGVSIIDIACGSAHSACITSSGKLYTWGKGRWVIFKINFYHRQNYFHSFSILRYGRLGHGNGEDQLKPKMVEALIGYRVIDVACGSGDAQTLCITDDDSGKLIFFFWFLYKDTFWCTSFTLHHFQFFLGVVSWVFLWFHNAVVI